MTVKMTFPDGTVIEGEVSEIMELVLELRKVMGIELPRPDELNKHR